MIILGQQVEIQHLFFGKYTLAVITMSPQNVMEEFEN